jgi:transcriptional regulator with XRE-family HTH domain
MENPGLQKIGRLIKTLRENDGLTQSELAKKAGLTQAAISQFEEGKRIPSTKALHKIADGLGVSLEVLLCDPQGQDSDNPEKEMAIRQLVSLVEGWSPEKIMNLNRFIAPVLDDK